MLDAVDGPANFDPTPHLEKAFLEIKDGYVDTGAAEGKDTRWVDPAQLKPETVTKEEVASKKHRKKLLWAVPKIKFADRCDDPPTT